MKAITWFSTLSLSIFIGCAGIADRMQSTDRKMIDEPPYYRDFGNKPVPPKASIRFLPIGETEESEWWSPSLSPLMTEMDKWTRQSNGFPLTEFDRLPDLESPAIRFGARTFIEERDQDDEDTSIDTDETLLLVRQPSARWKRLWQDSLNTRGDYVVMIQLGLSAYPVHQKDWKGNKQVLLGSGYAMDVPWLTSMDEPAPVVHVVGALLAPEGHIIRAGAEGFFSKNPGGLLGLIGWNRWIDDKDIDTILTTHRRKDLPDEPLAWKAAVRELVGRLTMKSTL